MRSGLYSPDQPTPATLYARCAADGRPLRVQDPPFHWYLQYGGILLPGVILGVGFAYYWFVQRHRTGVVAAHAREDAATDTTALGEA